LPRTILAKGQTFTYASFSVIRLCLDNYDLNEFRNDTQVIMEAHV